MAKQTAEIVTLWIAKEPEEIFSQPIRAAGTFFSDMVDWTRGKRLAIKVESSLDQGVQIQVIANTSNTRELATDINAALPCTPDGNISVGLAWDDWMPFVGVRVTVAVAPTLGELKIEAVVQE